MDPERSRRLIIAVIVSLLFFLTSWIEEEHQHTGSSRVVKSSVKSAARRLGRSLEGLDTDAKKHKNNPRDKQDEGEDDEYQPFLLHDEEGDEDDADEASYAKTFKSKAQVYIRTSAFHFDLHDCLPKFICEIHAHHISNDLTELEKDIIGLFRNYVVLEGPGSPVYSYQLAAHMGQLSTGLDPSPCQDLYPTCPLSRPQLLDVLRNIKSSKRMFY